MFIVLEPVMLPRVGSRAVRIVESSLRSNALGFRMLAMSSTQADSSTEKYELKNYKGARISGSAFMAQIRQRLDVKDESDEFPIPKEAFDSLIKEYDSLLEEGKEFKDRYQRALAETENVRERGRKQVEDAKLFAIQGFCKDLLEVADILDLAVGSVKAEDVKKADKPMKDLHEGVVMTQSVLVKTFAKHGLRQLNPVGEKFDPNFHEAVFQVPKEQAKNDAGHVEQVMKVGYVLKERPIRPAQVGVVNG